MTPAETLRALIERVKAATANQQRKVMHDVLIELHKASIITDGIYDAARPMLDAEAYLDAALTLVPVGWYTLNAENFPDKKAMWALERARDWAITQSNAATLPLACLAAVLRAYFADMEKGR